MQTPHRAQHRSHRAGWLRAAVLGANDGIVSTAALIVGGIVLVAYIAAVSVLRISEGRDLYHMVADRFIKGG